MKKIMMMGLMTGLVGMAGAADMKKMAKPNDAMPPKGTKVMSYTIADESQCEGHAAQGKFMGQVKQANGAVDMLAPQSGVIHMVTCNTAEEAKTVQAGMMALSKELKAMMKKDNPKVCQECVRWMEMFQGDQVTDEVVKTKMGAMWMATSSNPMMVSQMHAMDKAAMAKMSKKPGKKMMLVE